MNSRWIVLLIVLPMATAIATMLLRRRSLQRIVGVSGLLLNIGVAITVLIETLQNNGRVLVTQLADWPAPFGISVVVDPMSALILTSGSMVLLATYLYAIEQLPVPPSGSLFHPLFHALALGVQWSFLAGDLFNLFVAFEIMLMSSYVLLVHGGTKQQVQQAHKYVLLNLLASLLFVTACGLLYGHLGTLNMADLARMSRAGQVTGEVLPVIGVLLFVFGAKTAIFPIWFWLPDSYPTMPAALAGLFGGLLTKVGCYALFRVFVMIFGPAGGPVAATFGPIILISAGFTMFVGVLGAVSMGSMRRILSIHIISQIGYMVLAVGLAMMAASSAELRQLAVAGGIFFILQHMVIKCALFLCGGLMQSHAGGETDELATMGGLARRVPMLAVLFFLAALSLAGLPPLSGFFAKYVVIREAFRGQFTLLALVALATGLLTLLSMLKIWSAAFWSPVKVTDQPIAVPRTRLAMASTTLLVCLGLAMGLGAEQLFKAANVAAAIVVDPTKYIHAVLGEIP